MALCAMIDGELGPQICHLQHWDQEGMRHTLSPSVEMSLTALWLDSVKFLVADLLDKDKGGPLVYGLHGMNLATFLPSSECTARDHVLLALPGL